MSVFWFEFLAALAPNHLVSTERRAPAARVPSDAGLAGRMMLVRRCEMLPSSASCAATWPGRAGRSTGRQARCAASRLPPGLREADRLPEPIFTPSTKAAIGDHDEHIDVRRRGRLVGGDRAEEARALSLAAYRRAAAHAARRGIILADTKFELGVLDGSLVLADEVLTPDSSRFWPADALGARPHPPELRQAAGARRAGGVGLGQGAAAPAAVAGHDRRHPGALRRGLRAAVRPSFAAWPGG